MTVVSVNPGACGFVTRITPYQEHRRAMQIELESSCKAVHTLDVSLRKMGELGFSDVLSRRIERNRVFLEGSRSLSHASCPALSAIIKAAEVELGLNIPARVSMEFEPVEEKMTTAVKS